MAGAGGVPAALSGAEEAAPREGAGLLVAPGAELDKARGAVSSTSDIFFSLDERVRNVRKLSISSFEYPNSAYAISSSLTAVFILRTWSTANPRPST